MLFREKQDKDEIALALCLLGEVRLLQGDLRQARELATEAVLEAREAEGSYCIGYRLIILAKVAAAEGQTEQAVRLFGAAEPRIDLGSELEPFERAYYERAVEEVRAQLGEKVFAEA